MRLVEEGCFIVRMMQDRNLTREIYLARCFLLALQIIQYSNQYIKVKQV